VVGAWSILPTGELVLFGFSEPHLDHPEEKGQVRATCHVGGFVMRPLNPSGTSCEVTYISKIDLGGSIPKAIADKVHESGSLQLADMAALIDRDRQQSGEGGGKYQVDMVGKLKDGFTQEDVEEYVNSLQRRVVADWLRFPWLQTSDGAISAAAASLGHAAAAGSGFPVSRPKTATVVISRASHNSGGQQAAMSNRTVSPAANRETPYTLIIVFGLLVFWNVVAYMGS